MYAYLYVSIHKNNIYFDPDSAEGVREVYVNNHIYFSPRHMKKETLVAFGWLLTTATTAERKSTKHQGIKQQPGAPLTLRDITIASKGHQKSIIIKRAPSRARRMCGSSEYRGSWPFVQFPAISRFIRNFGSHGEHVGFLLMILIKKLINRDGLLYRFKNVTLGAGLPAVLRSKSLRFEVVRELAPPGYLTNRRSDVFILDSIISAPRGLRA